MPLWNLANIFVSLPRASSKFLTALSEKKKPNIEPLTSVTIGTETAAAAFWKPSTSFLAFIPKATYIEGLDFSFFKEVSPAAIATGLPESVPA